VVKRLRAAIPSARHPVRAAALYASYDMALFGESGSTRCRNGSDGKRDPPDTSRHQFRALSSTSSAATAPATRLHVVGGSALDMLSAYGKIS